MTLDEVGTLCREMYEARVAALVASPTPIRAKNPAPGRPLYHTAEMYTATLPNHALDVFLSQMDPDGSGGWAVLHAIRANFGGCISAEVPCAYVKSMADHIEAAAKRSAKKGS